MSRKTCIRWLSFLPLLATLALSPSCRRTADPNQAEQAALKALEIYEPKYKLDDKGRVAQLDLEGRHVDDDAMEQVPHFPFLERLSLRGASVSDEGLLKLRDLKRLQALGITDTHVTDKGLATLKKMPSLRYVWVTQNDRLTPTGVDSLKKALPGINVYVMNSPPKKAEPAPVKKP